MTDPVTLDIVDNPQQERYEARIDGELVGYAEYQIANRIVVFTHTEVMPDHEGQGIASALARFALDDVQAQGQRKVVPLCPFIKRWIGRHREYIPLVFGVDRSIPPGKD